MSLIPRWVDGKGSQTFYSKHQPCCPLLLQTSGLMKLYPQSVIFPCTFAAAAASVTVVAVSDSLLSHEQLLPTVPLLWQVKKMWLFFPGLLQYFTALEVREAKCEKSRFLLIPHISRDHLSCYCHLSRIYPEAGLHRSLQKAQKGP